MSKVSIMAPELVSLRKTFVESVTKFVLASLGTYHVPAEIFGDVKAAKAAILEAGVSPQHFLTFEALTQDRVATVIAQEIVNYEKRGGK